jgi:hypothetical protein
MIETDEIWIVNRILYVLYAVAILVIWMTL